ncbi:MAG: cysteine--tRNA ligase [Alphaproteobacteria bacterium]|nr:cysteine--tRNA ligase [Alphaproteobacteria bacterium]
MPLKLYNTMSRSKEDFIPLDPGHVRMYVCGPTVYDRAHIGNARPVVVFDVLYRLLKATYPRVTYVRNITDVDDKIIAAAKEKGVPIDRLTAETTAAFHEDMAALGALAPDVEPRATEHIPQMIAMIQCLIASGNAYEADGHVLFNVPSMAEYGRLAKRDRREMIAGARVEVAPYKKDPADFVLWKPSDPDQPGWDSPWGRGRPGWHIECSAMSETHLGASFDIHGGGLDLVFPHHENEIAQSTCAHTGQSFARYWVHNGYLTVNGEKMSKSLGNFFTVRDLLDRAPGEAIRFYMLGTHYRQPLDWTLAGLGEARRVMDRFYGALREVSDVDAGPAGDISAKVRAALEDDLNTPLAITAMHEIATGLNKAEGDAEKARLKAELLSAGAVLGLLCHDPEAWFKGETGACAETIAETEIEDMIARRAEARLNKDFAEADRIRDTLAEKGVVLEDKAEGTIWRRAG